MNFPLTSIAWGMIQVALFCGVVLGLAWVVRGRQPQVISAILVGCCLACLALGALIWLPDSQWSVVPKSALAYGTDGVVARSPLATSETPWQTLDVPDKSPQSNENELAASRTSASGNQLATWILAHVQGFDRSVRSVEDAERLQPSGVSTNVLAMFAVGSILMVALWIYSWLSMRRILRNSQPLESQLVSEQVAEYSAKLKLHRVPRIRVSDQVPIGAIVGCFRHVLILHSSWPQWTECELRAVLVHELAHAARRDFLWVVISSWVRILFFYHPLVQLVVRRLRLEQELAADQLAAGFMESANAYGRALASLALRSQNSTRAPSPMLSAEQICIVRRITMLKHGSLVPRRSLLRWASCLTLATLLLSLPLSGLRGTSPDETVTAIDKKATAADASETDEAVRKEKHEASVKLAKEIEEKFPRLRFTGPMIWNPGRFQSPDIADGVRWAHYVYTALALENFRSKAKCTVIQNSSSVGAILNANTVSSW